MGGRCRLFSFNDKWFILYHLYIFLWWRFQGYGCSDWTKKSRLWTGPAVRAIIFKALGGGDKVQDADTFFKHFVEFLFDTKMPWFVRLIFHNLFGSLGEYNDNTASRWPGTKRFDFWSRKVVQFKSRVQNYRIRTKIGLSNNFKWFFSSCKCTS